MNMYSINLKSETKDILLLKNSLLKNNEINELRISNFRLLYMPLSTNKIISDRLLEISIQQSII